MVDLIVSIAKDLLIDKSDKNTCSDCIYKYSSLDGDYICRLDGYKRKLNLNTNCPYQQKI
jgi:hypothetical protein